MRNLTEQKEIWKPIPGYEGIYEFSNLHNIKSLSRNVKNWKGSYILKERILKSHFDGRYYKVSLYLNGKGKKFSIHQLVAMEHFSHVPCGYNLVVDHIDTDTLNNEKENLRIITQRENTSRSKKNTSSEYTGVYWNKKNNNWQSAIRINGKKVYLGNFDSQEEASLFYDNALKNHLLGLQIEIKTHKWSSKYKGVSWFKTKNKWLSRIRVNGKDKFLGYFNNEIEAHNCCQNALLKLNK